MGEMKQLWAIPAISGKIHRVAFDDKKLVDSLFEICTNIANEAKSGHSYRNIKGELESSIGVVILKDREEVLRWSVEAKSGSDPAKGINDLRTLIETNIIGKNELPDGTDIPANGIIGIVFAAAPYSGLVESRGRTVLDSFTPDSEYVFSIIKTAIKG